MRAAGCDLNTNGSNSSGSSPGGACNCQSLQRPCKNRALLFDAQHTPGSSRCTAVPTCAQLPAMPASMPVACRHMRQDGGSTVAPLPKQAGTLTPAPALPGHLDPAHAAPAEWSASTGMLQASSAGAQCESCVPAGRSRGHSRRQSAPRQSGSHPCGCNQTPCCAAVGRRQAVSGEHVLSGRHVIKAPAGASESRPDRVGAPGAPSLSWVNCKRAT